MHAEELLLSILKLDSSWSISEIDIDEPSNRLDITLCYGSKKKRFFWQPSKTVTLDQYITLRHLPIWGMRTFLHVPNPDTVDADVNWSPYSKCTHEMDKFIADALDNCRTNQGAAKVTGLTTADIREASERIGIVTSQTEMPVPEEIAAEPVEHLAERSFDIPSFEDSAFIPPETHPGWQQLIDGRVELISRAVGLQMLLQRVRQAMANNPTETERLSGINLVRQYFIKNQSLHEQDIKLLFGGVSPGGLTVRPVPGTGIANENHPQWRNFIDAKVSLETDNVGLQMMLEQIRRSVAVNPSESNYLVGAKILKQFFLKHKNQLSAELAQLGFADVAPAQDITVTGVAARVPDEIDQIWQRIIDGESTVRTNIVSLQMMMKQLRQSVARNPSNETRMAGARILRRFFLKHQSRLSDELQQLNMIAGDVGNVLDSAVASASSAIPQESSPVWEKLINGDLQIHTDAVALKMMLERARISIQNNPSYATRMAGVKILRRYFIKHQQTHRAELNQLMAA